MCAQLIECLQPKSQQLDVYNQNPNILGFTFNYYGFTLVKTYYYDLPSTTITMDSSRVLEHQISWPTMHLTQYQVVWNLQAVLSPLSWWCPQFIIVPEKMPKIENKQKFKIQKCITQPIWYYNLALLVHL